MCLKPDTKKEQSGNVDGEDAAYQRPAQGHLKHQSGPTFSGAENYLVHGVLRQLVPLPLILDPFRIQSHSISGVRWHLYPHFTSLAVKRVPLHIIDTPPEISVLLSSYNLVFWSFELICSIGSARVPYGWGNVQISGQRVKEKSVIMIPTRINVFKDKFGIPKLFIICLPKIIQTNILLEVQ